MKLHSLAVNQGYPQYRTIVGNSRIDLKYVFMRNPTSTVLRNNKATYDVRKPSMDIVQQRGTREFSACRNGPHVLFLKRNALVEQ